MKIPDITITAFKHRNKWRALCFFMVFCTATAAMAQKQISLKQAINTALQNRKNIASARIDLNLVQLKTGAMHMKYWPQLSFEYNYLYNPILQTSILPVGVFNPAYPADATKSIQFGTKWSQSAGLTLYQPIVDLSISRQIRESKYKEQISAVALTQTEYELAYAVAQAYINITIQQEQINVAAVDTLRTWTSLLLQQQKFGENRLLKSDLNKALINHNNALQEFKNATYQSAENKVLLLYLLGQTDFDKTDFRVDESLPIPFDISAVTIKPDADKIPELREFDIKSRLPALQEKSENAKFIPTVALKGFLGANQYSNNFNPVAPDTWFGLSYVGIDLKAPILFGEDKSKEIQQLKLQAAQLTMQKDDKASQYLKDAVTARLNMQRLQSQLKTAEANLALSRVPLQIIQDRVKEGQETASALNTEEAGLQQLEGQYETLKKQLLLFGLDYLKATGQLFKLWQ